MKQINLKINYFEFGYLFASVKEDCWNKMPRGLWLKLNIISLAAYKKHPAFNKESAEQLKQWHEELQKLEGGKHGN